VFADFAASIPGNRFGSVLKHNDIAETARTLGLSDRGNFGFGKHPL
jgi:hypothetical protein